MSNDEEIGMQIAADGLQGVDASELTLPGSSDHINSNDNMQTLDMNLDNGGITTEKRPRTMTDSTSVTAGVSLDGSADQEEFASTQMKPPMESLHETTDDDCDLSQESIPVESRCWIWFKRILLFFVLFGIVGFASVMIGARIERKKFANAEGTTHLYQSPNVCGLQDPLSDEMGIIYNSVEEAHDDGAKIAHCGDCGSCSSAHDMEIMSRTKESLTRDSTRCAFKSFLGRASVEKCMEERIGFTPACEDCWMDNIFCSFKACKFTCIKYKLFRQDNNNGDELNDCLKCDERMCGPQFIQCSGANRRRMGIVSDIGRNFDDEQCKSTDVNWNTIFAQDN